jgi:hypothetical protein
MTKLELTKDELTYLGIELNMRLIECNAYSEAYAKSLNSTYKKITGNDHTEYLRRFGGEKNVATNRKYKKPGYIIR